MNCNEAQTLIDRGVQPGSHPPLQARLSAHLARCPRCCAYRDQNATLLNQLLVSDASEQRATPGTPRPQTPARSQSASQTARVIQWAGVVVSVLLLCVLAWIAGIALRTNQNLDAMIIAPTPTAQPTSTPDTATVASLNEPELSSEETTAAPTEAPPAPDSTPTTAAQSDTMQQVAITEAPPAGQPVNILLLGNDRRPDEPPDEYPRTDAIMLIRVDPQNNRIALLSLPRDLWMQIPGYWPNRINNAYQIGETYAPGSGLDLTRASVSSLTGLPINYVAMIDFQGFVGLIDTIGGITIDVEKELYDEQYPTMDYGYQVVHFVPGPQHMDGTTALIYSRIRHPDSDFYRIQRQQDVMVAIGERLHERGDLQNVLAADQISGALVGFVQTDMPRERIVGLMWALRHTDPANVDHYTVTSDMVSMGVGSDRYALVPNRAAINQLALAFMGEQ